jgi:fumarate hydratase subunit alpha
MRTVAADRITDAVAKLCVTAAYQLPPDVREALLRAQQTEVSPAGCALLGELIENADLASAGECPMCQDTGIAIVFVELGREVLVDGDLTAAIDEGVRRGYRDGYLRASIVADPLRREPTGDNAPAVIHFEPVPGDRVRLTLLPKGAGSENMSALRMLKPADGEEGVKQFVLDTVRAAGANPCPPIIVGVGLGATMDGCALLAKRALLRPVGELNSTPHLAALEQDLLAGINGLGIGPGGLGGIVTALAVAVEAAPCHIASLPVAVSLQCHAARRAEVTL